MFTKESPRLSYFWLLCFLKFYVGQWVIWKGLMNTCYLSIIQQLSMRKINLTSPIILKIILEWHQLHLILLILIYSTVFCLYRVALIHPIAMPKKIFRSHTFKVTCEKSRTVYLSSLIIKIITLLDFLWNLFVV